MALNLNTFSNGPGNYADADKMNGNFDTIADVLNGGIEDEHVDEISESKVGFDTNSGHDHDGENSRSIGVNESKITFDDATGHNHDGDDGGALVALAVANGNQGSVQVKSGNVEINNDSTAEITFGSAFPNAIIGVDVFREEAGGFMSNKGLGLTSDGSGNEVDYDGYYVADVLTSSFKIKNQLGSSLTFYWRAIGV